MTSITLYSIDRFRSMVLWFKRFYDECTAKTIFLQCLIATHPVIYQQFMFRIQKIGRLQKLKEVKQRKHRRDLNVKILKSSNQLQ